MAAYDFAALEDVEYAASADLYRAAPASLKSAYDVDLHEVAGVDCLSCRRIEPAMIFRRAVRLGVGTDASEDALDAVIAHMRARGERYAIPVAPESRPSAIAAWLEARGFTRGYAWMKFVRPCEGALETATELELRVIDAGQAEAFGRIVAESFGLPARIAPWMAAIAGRPGWVAVMAFDGAEPVAAGACFVKGDHAWLGLGGTLASHRRRGAQSALLARRIAEAAARGARIAVTETGERLPELPSHSYRNILRAGFEEAYLRQNYLSPDATA